MESGGVKIGGGFRVKEVDIDGAPVVAERGVGLLLDNRHGGNMTEGWWGWMVEEDAQVVRMRFEQSGSGDSGLL